MSVTRRAYFLRDHKRQLSLAAPVPAAPEGRCLRMAGWPWEEVW